MIDIAARRAELSPARPAIWFEGRWYSYAELNDRAGRLAAQLSARGIGKGERVSILAPNHLAHIELLLACAKLGCLYAPLNYRLTLSELRQLAGYLRPKLLLYDAAQGAVAQALQLPLQPLADYERWLQAAPEPPPSVALEADDVQMILLTGGTTGTPKGAMIPYRQSFYNAVNTAFSWGLSEADCAIQATPCFHAAISALSLPLLYLGARVVLQRSFEPGEYLRLVALHRCSILFLVPTMYQMLIQHPEFAQADLSSVRWAISGGAPCPEPVRRALAARGVPFRQGYGLTEAGVNCFAIELADAAQRPESVGKPVICAEAAICDSAGRPLPPGEVGELTLRGPHLFAGYFERPEATREVLRDGWLWTGDLAYRDAEGFYYLVGRRKEMYISGGENIYPIEIEQALYAHPQVAECAVVGVPDPQWGEVGLAAVVPAPGAELSPAGLKDFLRQQLAGYKVPKHIRIVAELPKSGAGKILKSALRERFGGDDGAP